MTSDDDADAATGREAENGRSTAYNDFHDWDFYNWTVEQTALLRSGRLDGVDLPNLIEEIETLERSEAAGLESAHRLTATHRPKRTFQPKRADSRSWTGRSPASASAPNASCARFQD